MSFRKLRTIVLDCDGESRRCHGTFGDFGGMSQGMCKDLAKFHGWKRVKGRYLCPECLKVERRVRVGMRQRA